MKKLAALLFLSLIFSCGGNSSENAESGNVLKNLTFSVDTLVIDRGEEIINLKHGINPSSISEDKKYFFHYTILGEVLSIIDLNDLRLTKQQVYEKEGPNAIVRHTTNIQAVDENQILFIGLVNQGIYDFDGNKIKAINFEPSQITGLTNELEFSRHNKIVRSKNREKYFSLPGGIGREVKNFW